MENPRLFGRLQARLAHETGCQAPSQCWLFTKALITLVPQTADRLPRRCKAAALEA